MFTRFRWLFAAWMALAVSAAQAAESKDVPETSKLSPPATSGSSAPLPTAESLSTSQQELAAEFKDLQGILMRMRDQIRQTDPNRATLIEKALKESGERGVEADFQDIVGLLQHEKFGDAARKQGKVNDDLDAILKLLLSEDRTQRILDEKALLRKYLNLLNGIIREQKDVQGRTAGGEDPQSLSGEQGGLAQRTSNLSKNIRNSEEKARSDSKDGDNKNGKPDDPKSDGKSDGRGDEKSNGESPGKSQGKSPNKGGDKDQGSSSKNPAKPGEKDSGKPGGKDSAKSDGKDPAKAGVKGDRPSKDPSGKSNSKDKPGETGKPSESGKTPSKGPSQEGSSDQGKAQSKSQQSQGQGQGQSQAQGQEPSEDQNDSSQQAQDPNARPPEENPVRKRLEAAREHMEQAKKNLDKAKKDGAIEEQAKALRELDTAKAELEEILRQLREEEMKRLLAMLEARFQKVLQVQREIYDGSMRLDKIPLVERSHAYEIDTGRLSNREAEIVMEVEKALSLLREEGSSVAMPEAVQQVHDDMQQIVHRLAEGKTEVLTQNIEMDVIRGLEEIIDALKKAQKNAENKKKPPGPSPNGQPEDPPLIEQLAELKMIRALQMRVNRRTERYSKLIDGEQASKEDVQDALRHLSDQESRVQKVTRDLELGKNE